MTGKQRIAGLLVGCMLSAIAIGPAQAAVISVTKEGSTVSSSKENVTKSTVISSAERKTDSKTAAVTKNDTAKESRRGKEAPATVPRELGPAVRVLIGSRAGAFPLSSPAGIRVFDETHTYRKDLKKPVSVTLSLSGGQVAINGKKMGHVAYIEPAVSSLGDSQAAVNVNGTWYRGKLVVSVAGSSMRLVNEVPMEHYIYGVVPKEAVPSWPTEALKAQAVAARTYAMYTMATAKGDSYDLEPTVAHQVYGGKGAEFAATTAAVDATRGIVMTYGGAPIQALFHADGGGYTEDSVHVWGGHEPYLKGVKDYAQNSDTSAWTVRLTRAQLESKLHAAGKDVGTLKEIKLSPLRKRPMNENDRGVSGRIKSAVFVGSKRSLTISGDSLMKLLGLKSTLFDFYVNVRPPATADSFKKPKAYHRFKKANDIVFIRGYGWGHGLGMSQWGAAAMAQKAGNAKEYYKTILGHYYTGITFDKQY